MADYVAVMECATQCELRKPFDLQFSVEEASSKCRHGWMRKALHDWLRRKGWDDVAERLENLSAAASSDDFLGATPPTDS